MRSPEFDVSMNSTAGHRSAPAVIGRRSTNGRSKKTVTLVVKRMFDLSSAAAALLVLSPMLLMLFAMLLVMQGRPIFIKHRRIGLRGRSFDCLKFRTMVVGADAVLADHLASDPLARSEWERSRKLRHDPRVTRIGQFLRKSSIDEIPQLLNIIKGDMSVVGPRPIVAEEIAFYGEKIRDYHEVRPGLTGLWQISGRSDVSYTSRVEFDAAYSASYTLLMDLAIIAKTVPAVLLSKGSY